jgi:hypothetical protein
MDSVAKMAGGQAELREELGNHGRRFEGGDDLQGAATRGTLFDVAIEHPDAAGLKLMRASAEGWGVSPWSAECA